MATEAQVAELRRKVSEPDQTTYTDEALNALIDEQGGDINLVAAGIWEEKASQFTEMVDISEAGSSRKNSQLMKNATGMAAYYRGLSPETQTDGRPRTRPIVRA